MIFLLSVLWFLQDPCWLPEGCPLPIEGPILGTGGVYLPLVWGVWWQMSGYAEDIVDLWLPVIFGG